MTGAKRSYFDTKDSCVTGMMLMATVGKCNFYIVVLCCVV